MADLIWETVAALREERLFDATIGVDAVFPSQKGGTLTERDFIQTLGVSGIFPHVDKPMMGAPISCRQDTSVLYDTLEFLHDEAIAQLDRGMVRKDQGQAVFRERINPDLAQFNHSMEMLANGQIVEAAPDQLRPLLDDPLPEDVTLPIREPLEAAIEQYRRRGATAHDKRSALKHLADVLEPMKGVIRDYVLPADEKALFDIANNFYVRHLNRNQQRSYDSEIWLDWMFYVYVATARAMIAVMDRDELRDRAMGEPPDNNGGLPL